jgi:predicted alpha/beta-hydrolase family hydrolase
MLLMLKVAIFMPCYCSLMQPVKAEPISIALKTGKISGLVVVPPKARAAYVMAHGAGAGMAHPFMAAVAVGLAERGIATLRYQFSYMEAGGKRPDPPAVAHAAVRAAVDAARKRFLKLPLFAGGKSFGGRMTSQAQATAPLDGVHGLVFFGFPLHAAGKPSRERAAHLSDVTIPMLFLQGTRDALADLDQLTPVCKALGARATLTLFEDADHSFHVPARTGRKDAEVMVEMLDRAVEWMEAQS